MPSLFHLVSNSRLGKRELAHVAHVEPHALVHLARDASRLAELPEPREELCTNRLDALEERRPVDAEARERVRPRLPSDESQLIQRHVAVGMVGGIGRKHEVRNCVRARESAARTHKARVVEVGHDVTRDDDECAVAVIEHRKRLRDSAERLEGFARRAALD